MKRFLLVGALCSAMTLGVAPVDAAAQARGGQAASAQATRFAFVNSQRIMAEAPGAREAQQTFEREMQRFRLEVDSLEQALQTLQTDFQRQQATLSPAQRQERQQAMQTQFATYQQRMQQMEQNAQRRQAELVEPIMKRISDTIEEIRREGSYGMIFDASAGVLITADPSLDVTERVLTRLRQTASR